MKLGHDMISVAKGLPPTASYWVGCDRAELRQRIEAQRHRMALPTDQEVRFDPLIAATAALAEHRVAARMAKRKRGLR